MTMSTDQDLTSPSQQGSTPRTAALEAPPVVAEELNRETLQALCNREVGAIHVRGFYPADIAAGVAQKAINHQALGHYHKQFTSSVGRVHMPHIDTKWDPMLTDRYHRGALEAIDDVRSLFYPLISPVDHIRLLLQELWPSGANIQHLRDRTCFVGAFRVFQPSTSKFFPHNDDLTEETDAPEVQDFSEQLVANIYLAVPESGGDLQLWLREPTPAEVAEIRDVEGLQPESIEAPKLVIHPAAGDLIIFSSRMLHAVTSGNAHRVGMASFIGCHGDARPLTYWS
jgi:hypothetical protein